MRIKRLLSLIMAGVIFATPVYVYAEEGEAIEAAVIEEASAGENSAADSFYEAPIVAEVLTVTVTEEIIPAADTEIMLQEPVPASEEATVSEAATDAEQVAQEPVLTLEDQMPVAAVSGNENYTETPDVHPVDNLPEDNNGGYNIDLQPLTGSEGESPSDVNEVEVTLYETEVCDINCVAGINNKYTVTYTTKATLEDGSVKRYYYNVTGFSSEELANAYANDLRANYIGGSRWSDPWYFLYGFEDDSLVDAEKIVKEGYDDNHCWGGTTSNILTLSGWGDEALKNLSSGYKDGKEGWKTEDIIMNLIGQRFDDEASNATTAITWFFNGYDATQGMDGWAHPVNTTETLREGTDALLKDYCVSDFIRYYGVNNSNSSLADILSKMNGDEDHDKCSMGIVFGYYNNTTGERKGGHVVTVTGYALDENGDVCRIVLADSDNSPDWGKESSTSDTDGRKYKNTYTTYGVVKNADGNWQLTEYAGDSSYNLIIDGVELLKEYNERTKNILERLGTKDIINNPDYSPVELLCADDVTFSSDGVPQYYDNKAVDIYPFWNAYGNVSRDNLNIRYKLLKDGEAYREFVKNTSYEEIMLYKSYNYSAYDLNSGFDLEPGTYTVSVLINPYGIEGYIPEAYYNNNIEMTLDFVILKFVDESGNVTYIPVQAEDNNEQEETTTLPYIELSPIVLDQISMQSGSDISFELPAGTMLVQTVKIMQAGKELSSADYNLIIDADGKIRIRLTEDFKKRLGKGVHILNIVINGVTYRIRIQITD